MIRVLQVLQNLNMGGAESYVMNIYREIDRSLVQFDFAVQHKGGFFEEEIKRLGGNIYYLPHFKIYNGMIFEKRLISLLKDHPEISIVHSHNNNIGAFAVRAAVKANVQKTVAHSHTNKKSISNWKDVIYCMINPYSRYLFEKYSKIRLACSYAAGKWQYGNKTNFSVINNAIDISKFAYNEKIRDELKQRYILQNRIVIGHVGRLEKVKNQAFLIEVFAEVHKKYHNTVLLIIGEGKEKENLIRHISKYGLDDSVIILNNQEEIEKYYQLMDVFVLTSLYEGFPMTLLEAQASGMWCVVSDRIDKETNLTGKVVYLDLKSDIKLWSEAVYEKAMMARDNCDIRLQQYDIRVIARELQNLYLNELG
ncbi:glycosyltransferase family 1 protein [Butyrivibrio sp. CB08]|uniref:glycosyltransferase n=1 Tax=Butyrivibrio sp. CB08 TaxID=2364879 RepID=UPI000EA94CF6|nr:glycosyltransferase [Butyrivibrio sp. CB08]RKM61919.1 glycosyltransferase family 1 protein [Butyrivibrio sp. CB08]